MDAEAVGEYDFEVKHRKGTENGNADALSRRLCFSETFNYCERVEVKSNTQRSLIDDVDNGESYNVAKIQANLSSVPDLGITKQVRLKDPEIGVTVQGKLKPRLCRIVCRINFARKHYKIPILP